MAGGDEATTPPASARAPRIEFIAEADPAPVDEALRRFVVLLRRRFAHLWPARLTVGVRSTTRPWPECWEHHSGFVVTLRMLKGWHDDLAAGNAKGGWPEANEWLHCVRNEIAESARTISGELCLNGHVDDVEIPRPQPGREAPVAPPLPGQAQPSAVKSDTAPRPDPWAGVISRSRPPCGTTHEADR